MSIKSLSPAAVAYLKGHGVENPQDLTDASALVRALRDAAPTGQDPLSQENLNYLTALADCVALVNEQLYEHHRALVDMLREGLFRAPRAQMLAYPSWNSLREKAVRLGVVPEELYGRTLPQPHLGCPEAYLRLKEGDSK